MKRAELIRQLKEAGCVLHRHGGDWLLLAGGRIEVNVRHAEIDNGLARHIKKYLGVK